MRSRSKLMAVGAAITIAGLNLSMIAPAQADIAPGAQDIVGVGSDTIQNMANFMADGDPFFGSAGVNVNIDRNRVFSFDATPDANDRAGYLNGSTAKVPSPLTPTIVLRAGHKPVLRPNGSGQGMSALQADTGHQIDFVRMSKLPSTAEQNSFSGGGLHVIKISTDNLRLAASATIATHASSKLTAAQLASIYSCTNTTWHAVDPTNPSTATIIPQAPDTVNSGTGKTFFNDLKAASNNTNYLFGTCVNTVEENDPTSITLSSSPADTIAPFSEGRFNLYANNYFLAPLTGTPLVSGIQLFPTTPDTTTYLNNRGLYIVYRDADKNSTVKWQPGSNQNWVQALFSDPIGTPYVNSIDGQAAIASGGGTPAYQDCGSGAGTAC